MSYGAAKAAQVNYTMSAAFELGAYGAQTEEVAEVIAFLASDLARLITANVIQLC